MNSISTEKQHVTVPRLHVGECVGAVVIGDEVGLDIEGDFVGMEVGF